MQVRWIPGVILLLLLHVSRLWDHSIVDDAKLKDLRGLKYKHLLVWCPKVFWSCK